MTQLGLYTFTSVNTVDNNNRNLCTYWLPPPSGQDTRVFHLNRGGQALQDVEHFEGSIVTTGTGPPAPSYAEISTTLEFIPPWLQNNLNTVPNSCNPHPTPYLQGGRLGNFSLDLAIQDFYLKVVNGGVGVLVDQYATGVDTSGNYILAQRSSKAVLNGDVTVNRLPGGTIATIQCTFVIINGKWTMPDGTKMYVF